MISKLGAKIQWKKNKHGKCVDGVVVVVVVGAHLGNMSPGVSLSPSTSSIRTISSRSRRRLKVMMIHEW